MQSALPLRTTHASTLVSVCWHFDLISALRSRFDRLQDGAGFLPGVLCDSGAAPERDGPGSAA